MQDFVSTPWVRVAGLATSMSAVWAIFILYGFPWMGLVWVTLACAGALWLRRRSTRSIWQVLDDVEAEPARALAASGPVTRSVPKIVR